MVKVKKDKKFTKKRAGTFRDLLLAWYDRHGRKLPWRYARNQKPDPYRVWLSEIMLQQTTVAAAGPYFMRFTEKWPTIYMLAAAAQADVMKEWAGLGYYSRARNLHKCAQAIVNDHGGVFPSEQAALKKLPGIGDYTSAAIMALAHNKPATVVDGNIERIMARYFAWDFPLPEAKKDLKNLASGLFKDFTDRPGDLAQALMDLGATVCIPKAPRCALCPVSKMCEGRKRGIAAQLPRQSKQKARPQKFGQVYWITNSKGQVLLERRAEKGMLGGMAGLPTSEWRLAGEPVNPPLKIRVDSSGKQPGFVRHTFTHFDLELELKAASLEKAGIPSNYYWASAVEIGDLGLPTVFKKAAKLFILGLHPG